MDILQNQSFTRRIRQGALIGIQVFGSYALAEYCFLVISLILRPALLRHPAQSMLLPQWRGTVILFLLYSIVGVLAGIATALIAKDTTPKGGRITKILILLVLLAFICNSAWALHSPGKWSLVGAGVLTAAATFLNVAHLERRPGQTFGLLMTVVWVLTSERVNESVLSPLWLCTIAAGALALFLATLILFNRFVSWMSANWKWAGAFGRACTIAAVLVLSFGIIVPTPETEARAPGSPPHNTAGGQRPNLVLIVLDTVRADHMGLYGYSRANTPRLQAFSSQSSLFTHFIAVAPLTLTSHASIFTGLYPQSHGSYTWFREYPTGKPLDENIPTLAEVLTTNGYDTQAIVANKYYLSSGYGTLRGFHIKDRLAPLVLASADRNYLLRNRLRNLVSIFPVTRDLDNDTITAGEVNKRAFQVLDNFKQQGAPFFLFLNYMDAHEPYLPPAPYDTLYPGIDRSITSNTYSAVSQEVNVLNHPLDARTRRHFISQYDGAIAYLDQKLGELIDHLKETGEFDRTMIVITSDHGESFGERNIVFHNAAVYQDEVHVPLLVKYPYQTTPERIDALTSQVDLMPTILDCAKVALPAGMQGIDLRTAATAPPRAVVAEAHGSAAASRFSRFQHIEWAVFSGTRKMIYSSDGRRELYDLSTDPNEQHDLFVRGSQESKDLRAILEAWSARTPPRFLPPSAADQEVEERLKSLGYAHGGTQ